MTTQPDLFDGAPVLSVTRRPQSAHAERGDTDLLVLGHEPGDEPLGVIRIVRSSRGRVSLHIIGDRLRVVRRDAWERNGRVGHWPPAIDVG